MFLQKNRHGVWYYRRPILLEDQVFWRGENGQPKKTWSRSLLTKHKPTAISLMPDAAQAYAEERASQYRQHGGANLQTQQRETEREREEREAREAFEAARSEEQERRRSNPERIKARKNLRILKHMDTGDTDDPEKQALIELVKESSEDLAKLKEANAALEARIIAQGGRPAIMPVEQQPPSDGRTIEELLVAYEADKSPGWAASSCKAVAPVFRVLREVFPDRSIASVTRQDARAVVALLEALPTQIGKRKELRGLTVPDAVEKGKALDLPTISPKTINDGYLLHIASIWNWAVKEQWAVSNPFTGLSVHDPVDDAERRDPFKPEQLSTLFSSAPWTAPWKRGGSKPGAFWVPLLCLFHGLRNAEAAGLRVEDVGEEDGVPVLHIVPHEGRPIKTAGSRGDLPVHPELLRIGFLDYVAERREAGEHLLFPEGTPNGRGQVAAKLAERFSEKVKRLGFTGRKLGMHSFRHNFEDRLRAAEIPERTALALSRRAEAGSSRVYGDGVSIRQKTEALAKVSYRGLDLSHLIPT